MKYPQTATKWERERDRDQAYCIKKQGKWKRELLEKLTGIVKVERSFCLSTVYLDLGTAACNMQVRDCH